MPRRVLLVGLFVLVALVGCSSPMTDAYTTELDKWTKHGEQYKNLVGTIFAHATYKSLAFRQAYETYKSSLMGSSLAEALAASKAEHAKHIEFFLAVATNERAWNDLDEDPSLWNVTLVVGTHRLTPPTSIVEQKRPLDYYTPLLPYVTDFYKLYVVSWDRSAVEAEAGPVGDATPMTLEIKGLKGAVSLSWPSS